MLQKFFMHGYQYSKEQGLDKACDFLVHCIRYTGFTQLLGENHTSYSGHHAAVVRGFKVVYGQMSSDERGYFKRYVEQYDDYRGMDLSNIPAGDADMYENVARFRHKNNKVLVDYLYELMSEVETNELAASVEGQPGSQELRTLR